MRLSLLVCVSRMPELFSLCVRPYEEPLPPGDSVLASRVTAAACNCRQLVDCMHARVCFAMISPWLLALAVEMPKLWPADACQAGWATNKLLCSAGVIADLDMARDC